jgi:excisionase family DNA binding protein
MKKVSSGEKVTIQVAANTLGVSKGTVIHYLNNGRLTRIREGSTVYISADEIRSLLEVKDDPGVTIPEAELVESETITGIEPESGDGYGTTVSVEIGHYEEILTRLGQLELENQNLLVYKDSMVKTKTVLSDREKELQQVRAKLHMIEEELRRLKRMGWWKRVFSRKWRMTGG